MRRASRSVAPSRDVIGKDISVDYLQNVCEEN